MKKNKETSEKAPSVVPAAGSKSVSLAEAEKLQAKGYRVVGITRDAKSGKKLVEVLPPIKD